MGHFFKSIFIIIIIEFNHYISEPRMVGHCSVVQTIKTPYSKNNLKTVITTATINILIFLVAISFLPTRHPDPYLPIDTTPAVHLGVMHSSSKWGIRLDVGLEGGRETWEVLVYNTIIINQQWERGTDEGGIRMSVHSIIVSDVH